jgi:hypothetical protein
MNRRFGWAGFWRVSRGEGSRYGTTTAHLEDVQHRLGADLESVPPFEPHISFGLDVDVGHLDVMCPVYRRSSVWINASDLCVHRSYIGLDRSTSHSIVRHVHPNLVVIGHGFGFHASLGSLGYENNTGLILSSGASGHVPRKAAGVVTSPMESSSGATGVEHSV